MAATETLFSVTQLSAELGITVRTLHFYEAQGLIAPQRVGNHRVYTSRDRARMILIMRGKRLGFSIRMIRDYLELYDIDPTQGQQTKTLLNTVQLRLEQLEEQRTALDETFSELRSIELQCKATLAILNGETAPELPPTVTSRKSRAVQIKSIGRSS